MAGSWPLPGVTVDPITLEPYPPAPPGLVRVANGLLAATARVAVCGRLRPGDPPPPGWELASVDGAPVYRQRIPGGWRYGDVRDCWLEYLRAEPRHAP